MAREVIEIEFDPSDPERVLEQMTRLAGARSGWINLAPGVVGEEEDEPLRVSAFSTLVGWSQPPVTMATWFPPKGGRRPTETETLGIMHPRGRNAIRQLAEVDIVLPEGWIVRQDHNRRGLIVLVPAGVSHLAVLDWSCRAAAALALVPLTGTWQARAFQPERR